MSLEKLREYVQALHYRGEMIDLRERVPKLGTAFFLHVYDEGTETIFAKSCYAPDPVERQEWERFLAGLVKARRLQVGPLPQTWSLPGTTVEHLAPSYPMERGPYVRLRSDEL